MGAISTLAPERATTLTTKEAWDAAFAAWEAAKVDFDFAEAAYDTAHKEAGGGDAADNNPAVAKLCDLLDKRAGIESEARFALILTPAPDFAAVDWKLTSLYSYGDFDGDDHSSAWHRRYPDAVMADVRRLQTEFAAAWLKSWVKDGGSVVIGMDGKAQIGWVVYDLSPAFVEPHPTWPNEVRETNALFNTAHHDATMKARYEALQMVPGGVDMVKAHMRAEGIRVAVYNREQGK